MRWRRRCRSATGRRALRYPRGDGVGVPLPARGEVLALGEGRVLREGNNVAILALGPRLGDALKAADELAARGLPATVVDARFAKPLDAALVEQLARHHEVLITIEEGSIGGFGSAVLHHLAWKGLLDGGLKVRPMVLPDFHRPRLAGEAAGRGEAERQGYRGHGAAAIGVSEALPGGQAITAR